MNYLTLSLEELEKKSIELAELIEKKFRPDIVIFIAAGGFLIAQSVSHYFSIPMIGIKAVRKGNIIKSIASPFLTIIPNKMKNYLRKLEMNSNIHKKKPERAVSFLNEAYLRYSSDSKRILILDDSVDTGHSMLMVKEMVSRSFPGSTIQCAALNIWQTSQDVIFIDYTLLVDTIIKTPMSKDSKYYKEFTKRYNRYLSALDTNLL